MSAPDFGAAFVSTSRTGTPSHFAVPSRSPPTSFETQVRVIEYSSRPMSSEVLEASARPSRRPCRRSSRRPGRRVDRSAPSARCRRGRSPCSACRAARFRRCRARRHPAPSPSCWAAGSLSASRTASIDEVVTFTTRAPTPTTAAPAAAMPRRRKKPRRSTGPSRPGPSPRCRGCCSVPQRPSDAAAPAPAASVIATASRRDATTSSRHERSSVTSSTEEERADDGADDRRQPGETPSRRRGSRWPPSRARRRGRAR